MELNDLKIKYKSFSIFDKIIFYNIIIFLLNFILNLPLRNFFQLSSNFENLLSAPWTLLTYSFTHNDPFELIFNMLILFYVSKPLVNIFNNKIPLKLYFYGILIGGLFFLFSFSYLDINSSNTTFPLTGSSAGIRALLIFLCMYMSNKLVRIAFWNIELKYVLYFILLYDLTLVILSLFSDSFSNFGGNISHIGGDFIGMYFYYNLYSSKKRSFFNLESIKSYFFTKSTMKYYKNKNAKKQNLKNNAATQKRIDIILEKISKSGYDNLSKDEKEFLFKIGKK